MMSTMTHLESLRVKADRLEDEAQEARREYDEALLNSAPFRPLDIVEVKFYPREGWKQAMVDRLSVGRYSKDRIVYFVRLLKKDGTPGAVVRELWSGEIRPVTA